MTSFEDVYSSLLRAAPSEYVFFVAGISVVHAIVLFLAVGHYYVLALFSWSKQYKVQPDKAIPTNLATKAMIKMLLDVLVLYPLFTAAMFPVARLANVALPSAPLPTIGTVVVQTICSLLFMDCGLYWVHRSFHVPFLYRHFHKVHHEAKVNISAIGHWFHPVEDLANLVPFIFAVFLFKMHYVTVLLWIIVNVTEIVDSHSGYGVPWSLWSYARPSSKHDFHHSHNVGCFGLYFTFWDWAMGTDVEYRKHIRRKLGHKE